jgi:uncharacterized protein YcfJ
MKKMLMTTAFAIFAASAAQAQTVNATIEDHYRTVVKQVPHTEQVCNTVEVPIYGRTQGQASTGDTVLGAVIGGAIGNQFGGGSGKDAMTVLGAIVGADVANKRGSNQQVITGYRQEQRCFNNTSYTSHQEEVYSHSTIRFKENGRWVTLQFQR